MNKQTLGTCGNCGGAVTVDTIYWSVVPPRPQCESCGAFASHGPVIDMQPLPKKWKFGQGDVVGEDITHWFSNQTSTLCVPTVVTKLQNR